ncbi:DUF5780 domain-containing protein [Clostridium sp.]|uniref:DUF5780 domain-containing protein n=1 Tax=Clostridium sp. TaxID=1506 RepID=UPI001A58E421|nr:DUF5780 domain-containing protein [Clostridium sp.]MBK5236665.1 zinc-ribbon domain-containing protein [Clostridium sp.]
MKCSKCGNDNLEDALFCSKCGANTSDIKISVDEISTKEKKSRNTIKSLLISNKKFIKYEIIGIISIFIIIAVIFSQNSPAKEFERAINNNKPVEASNIYSSKIEGTGSDEEKVLKSLNSDIKNIETDFMKNKLNYTDAIAKLKNIQDIGIPSIQGQVSISKENVEKLNVSRTSFKVGSEFLKNKDYKNGLTELKKVINVDENYKDAQELISNSIKEYKAVILSESLAFTNKKDYDSAISLLASALIIIPNDSDITAKKSIYEKSNEVKKAAELKKNIASTKANQQVTVESSTIIVQASEYKSLYPDMIRVLIRNKSNKIVKNMKVSSLAYDSNLLPIKVKTEYLFTSAPFEFIGIADNVNIVPGAVFGDGVGWNLDEQHGISKVLSCVKEVEYYDGTTWINPYYEYWIEQYKEKSLK